MLFITLYQLQDPIDVVLGDGRALTAVGRGEVVLDMILPNGESRSCMLRDVLYVPKFSYNPLSVVKSLQPGSLRFVNPALKANSIVPSFLQAV